MHKQTNKHFNADPDSNRDTNTVCKLLHLKGQAFILRVIGVSQMEDAKYALQLEKRKRKQAKKDEKKRIKRQQQSITHPPTKRSRPLASLDTYSTIPPLSSSSSSSSSSSNWNFAADYNDHFETPLVAYQDILPVLQSIATAKGKNLHDLIVYDPYYCKGQMVKHLQSLGIRRGAKSIAKIS